MQLENIFIVSNTSRKIEIVVRNKNVLKIKSDLKYRKSVRRAVCFS